MSKLFNSDFAKHSKFNFDFVGNIKKKEQWEILVNQFDRYIESSKTKNIKEKIPRKIHQIWIGPKKLPLRYKKWMDSWKFFNPEWEYKLWLDIDIKKLNLVNEKFYKKSNNPGYKSDVARYEILNKYGGIYIDTDFECLKKIPKELLNYDFLSCIIFDKQPIIANGMMMATPNCNFLEKTICSIKKQETNDINEIMRIAGPHHLTKNYFELSEKEKEEILILPSNYFYPFPNFELGKEIQIKNQITNVSIAIHHWEMSWMKKNILIRIIKKIIKISSNLKFISTKKI